ncbi:unnamed protein product [Musa acuminata subsp. burmannicoides]
MWNGCVRNKPSLSLEEKELGILALILDLLAELLELALLGLVLLLRLPHVLDVAEAPRVPSVLVQKLQCHTLLLQEPRCVSSSPTTFLPLSISSPSLFNLEVNGNKN